MTERSAAASICAMDLNEAHQVAALLPLDLALEPYRQRLTPLAQATLEGSPRRLIERRRALVLPDVWDARLETAVTEGVARLRGFLDAAEEDLRRGPRASRLAAAVVDRVLFELLEDHDRNVAALAALEAELREVPPADRARCAQRAARGAGTWARIPRNEIRAALIRVSRVAVGRGLDRPDAVDESVRHLARLLATDERRAAARAWVSEMAAGHAEPFPLLSHELATLAAEPPPADAGDDAVWLETCFGIATVESLGAAMA